jgi:hypothetical protein
MRSQVNTFMTKLLDLLEILLNYSLFHYDLEGPNDYKIYKVIRKIGDVRKMADQEISPELFDDLIYSLDLIGKLVESDFNFLKYYSNLTDIRIKDLVNQLKKENLPQEEIDKTIDALSIHLYKMKIMNQ